MKRGDYTKLSDVIGDYIESSSRLKKGLDRVAVAEAWNKVMGAPIKKRTTGIRLENDILYIQLNSSVLRQELSYGRDKIVAMLNEELGKKRIKKLVLG